jgi:hypothetical protein
MDALALLCTLYAEGPVTLARLRQADCATIERVIAMDANRLAAILPGTEATARRFQREARNLIDRLGGEGDASPVADALRPSPIETVRPSAIERVLATWRERDSEEDLRVEVLQPVAPAAAAALEAGAVDGLDSAAAAALARVGVQDLRALATCDALAIARASGIAWSRLTRLRALAARAVGPVSEPVAAVPMTAAPMTAAPMTAGQMSAGPMTAAPMPGGPLPAARPLSAERPSPGVRPLAASLARTAPRALPLAEQKVSPSERPTAAHEALADFEHAPALQHATQHEGAGGPFA